MLKLFTVLIGLLWRVFLIVGGLVLSSLWNAAWAFFTSPKTTVEDAPIITSVNDVYAAMYNGEVGLADLHRYTEEENH